MQLTCDWCEETFEKSDKEVRRQQKKGRKTFFCSLSCGAYYRNSKRTDLTEDIIKECLFCKTKFQTRTGKLEAKFCSRSCASSGSMTEKRINKAKETGKRSNNFSTSSIAKGLRTREAWKYEELDKYLKSNNTNYQFEYCIDNSIFDLAILDQKLLIEFDGSYHQDSRQQIRDDKKEQVAISNGWQLKRIQVENNTVIDSTSLSNI